MEVDPLMVLLDFLVGDSVELLSRRHRMPRAHVEDALRSALALYGYEALRDTSHRSYSLRR